MIAVVYNTEGRVLDVITGPASSVVATTDAIRFPHIIVEDLPDVPERLYVHNGVLCEMPESPGEGHEFNYATREWELDAATRNAAMLVGLRAQRDRLLALCDWTQGNDTPLTTTQVGAWRTYRQQLRDMPTTYADVQTLSEVTWPIPPA